MSKIRVKLFSGSRTFENATWNIGNGGCLIIREDDDVKPYGDAIVSYNPRVWCEVESVDDD